jgi:hypothetical protein
VELHEEFHDSVRTLLGGRPYHPHAHGLVEAALQGGASGAIIVEGIQTIEHAVAGLRRKILVIRDQNVAGNPTPGGTIPSWDLSVNFVPIA